MSKYVALILCSVLSGCAGNYMDKVSQEEIDKYCPGNVGDLICNINIEKNLDEINQVRAQKREQLKQQQQLEQKKKEELIKKLVEKTNFEYKGNLIGSIQYAMSGGGFEDGLYYIDTYLPINYCSRIYCYGSVPGLKAPIVYSGFTNLIAGGGIGMGYHRAYIYEGKIMITKVNI